MRRKERRAREIVRRILLNLCIIGSMSLITFQILDWYNPYMDFMGHAKAILNLVCVSTLILGFWNMAEEERRL